MPLPFKNILIFEDELARSRRFLPLTYTRALCELRSGCYTGIERVRAAFPDVPIYLHTAEHLKAAVIKRCALPVNEIPQGRTLLINARTTFAFADMEKQEIADKLPLDMAKSIRVGEPVIAPHSSSSSITALWDIIHYNATAIASDATMLQSADRLERIDANLLPFVNTINPEQLFVHPSARIGYGVVFDCSEGPIVIEAGVRVMPQTTIVGPAVIGKNSLLKIGTKLYGGTTIGPVCKMGGEIENSIVQGYSNKQHDGYLGHSYLGEWVNLGAGTNTSDLRNDYSNVPVTIEDETFDTKSLFIGLLMGDHSKSAIGTQFNTGTVVGVCCNIFGAGFPPKYIPNFSWGEAREMVLYRYEKAIEVARKVVARRDTMLSPEDEKLLRMLFEKRTSVEV